MSKMNKELTERRFDLLLDEGEKFKPVACVCGQYPNVKVVNTTYGSIGARCVCEYCGRHSSIKSVHDTFASRSRIGSVMTGSSIVRGIIDAINQWNADRTAERILRNE